MLNILLIDDNPHDRLLAKSALERNFSQIKFQEVIHSEDLQQALSAEKFDIVITDYQLRWTTGLQVLHEIKKYYPEKPVVMFTNSGSEEIAVEAMKSGLDDYVIKSANSYMRLPSAVHLALERAENQRKVAYLEKRLQTILNQLEVGVYRITAEGVLLEANTAFLHLLGLDTLTEVPINQTLKPYFLSTDYAGLLTAITKQNPNLLKQEVMLHRADGKRIWVQIKKKINILDHTTIIEGVVEDITERKQAEQEREQLLNRESAARAEAEAANRVKDEFLAILSHELRSPLNPILGWSKILNSHKLTETKRNEAIKIIERNAKLQAQLVEDLLDISYILRGQLRLSVSSVNLETIILAVLQTVQLAAEVKGIQIQTAFTSQANFVLGDPTRLQQIIWNLLSNAIKFTPINGRVEIHLDQIETQAQIQVIDTGQGISKEFLPYVFDYFRQENSTTTRKFGGLGLGLAIVKHLVQMHGGTIDVESPGNGQGTTFTVKLPLIKNQSLISEEPELINYKLALNGIKVLVVENEDDSLQLINFILEEAGAEVIALKSSSEAITTVVESQPDILILDIAMPDLDGYMLLRQIRNLPPKKGSQIPAIALTAYAGEFNQQKALSAGFQGHLSKPVEFNQLILLITQLVQ